MPTSQSSTGLKMAGLPVMQNLDDFSSITHISKFTLFQLSRNSTHYYKTYYIPKKNGKDRLICQPSRKLKALQGWILVNILKKLSVSGASKGFEKQTSIVSNVEPHKYANSTLTIDIKDFFSSITRNKVFNVFRTIGYNNLIATILTNLCTYDGFLPQGGPCSPKLANLICWSLDVRIQGYVGKRGITYTRYADDLTFSSFSAEKLTQIIPVVKLIINNEGFEINSKKTRLAGLAKAKIVTGLVISNDSFGIGREKYKILRSNIYKLTLVREQENETLLKSVQGYLAFLKSVDQKRFYKAVEYTKKLQQENPEKIICKINC